MPTLDHENQIEKAPEDDYCRHILNVVNGKVSGTLRVHWCADHPVTEHEEHIYSISRFSDFVDPEQICVVDKLITDLGQRGGAVAYGFLCISRTLLLRMELSLYFASVNHIWSTCTALSALSPIRRQ